MAEVYDLHFIIDVSEALKILSVSQLTGLLTEVRTELGRRILNEG